MSDAAPLLRSVVVGGIIHRNVGFAANFLRVAVGL